MKKAVIRYGLYGSLWSLLLFVIVYLFFYKSSDDYDKREIVGWASIVLSLIFVFVGIKYFRDKINNGYLSFGQGMKLGTLITLFPSVIFGIWSLIYAYYLDPDFNNKYFAAQVEKLKKTVPTSELAARVKEMESYKELSANPVFAFGLMFLSVFLIGLIITIISSFILKRKPGTSLA